MQSNVKIVAITYGNDMIPTKKQCFKILENYQIPSRIIEHSEMVLYVAVFLADKCNLNNAYVNTDIVKAAALLHDLDKLMVIGNPSKHGFIAADILAKKGMNEITSPIKKHSLSHIKGDLQHKPLTLEEKIIFYSDKICTNKLVSLEDRALAWIKKYPQNTNQILEEINLVGLLEKEILAFAKINFKDIEKHVLKL